MTIASARRDGADFIVLVDSMFRDGIGSFPLLISDGHRDNPTGSLFCLRSDDLLHHDGAHPAELPHRPGRRCPLPLDHVRQSGGVRVRRELGERLRRGAAERLGTGSERGAAGWTAGTGENREFSRAKVKSKRSRLTILRKSRGQSDPKTLEIIPPSAHAGRRIS